MGYNLRRVWFWEAIFELGSFFFGAFAGAGFCFLCRIWLDSIWGLLLNCIGVAIGCYYFYWCYSNWIRGPIMIVDDSGKELKDCSTQQANKED